MDLCDPTLGGLLDPTQPADEIGAVRAVVVRSGEGFITKEGRIPLTTQEGDEVVFLKENAIPFAHNGDTFYLINEGMTSGVLNRDPYPGEMPQYSGVDMDKLMDQIDLQEKIKKDPDHSETQD